MSFLNNDGELKQEFSNTDVAFKIVIIVERG